MLRAQFGQKNGTGPTLTARPTAGPREKKESRPCLSSQPATTIIAPCRHRPPCLVRLVPSAPVRLTSTPKPPQWNLKKCRDRPWRARTAARGPGSEDKRREATARHTPHDPLSSLGPLLPPPPPASTFLTGHAHEVHEHPLATALRPPVLLRAATTTKNRRAWEREREPTHHPSSRPPVLFFPAFSPAHTSPPFYLIHRPPRSPRKPCIRIGGEGNWSRRAPLGNVKKHHPGTALAPPRARAVDGARPPPSLPAFSLSSRPPHHDARPTTPTPTPPRRGRRRRPRLPRLPLLPGRPARLFPARRCGPGRARPARERAGRGLCRRPAPPGARLAGRAGRGGVGV